MNVVEKSCHGENPWLGVSIIGVEKVSLPSVAVMLLVVAGAPEYFLRAARVEAQRVAVADRQSGNGLAERAGKRWIGIKGHIGAALGARRQAVVVSVPWPCKLETAEAGLRVTGRASSGRAIEYKRSGAGPVVYARVRVAAKQSRHTIRRRFNPPF